MEEDRADQSINSHLSDMMQGGSEEDAVGGEGIKTKKITFSEATASKPVLKPTIKPLKPAFEAHNHTNPQTIIEASIKLTDSAPVQDFIVNLQELLKNGQMVDKMFAFCPINPDGTN